MNITLGQYMKQTGLDQKMAFYAFACWDVNNFGVLYMNIYSLDNELIERRKWRMSGDDLPKPSYYTLEFVFDDMAVIS